MLPKITVPCQIIVGLHDPFVPVSNAEGLHKGLPKSQLNVIDCGHFVWEDEADTYRQACLRLHSGRLRKTLTLNKRKDTNYENSKRTSSRLYRRHGKGIGCALC